MQQNQRITLTNLSWSEVVSQLICGRQVLPTFGLVPICNFAQAIRTFAFPFCNKSLGTNVMGDRNLIDTQMGNYSPPPFFVDTFRFTGFVPKKMKTPLFPTPNPET